jgi:hypothetical protein
MNSSCFPQEIERVYPRKSPLGVSCPGEGNMPKLEKRYWLIRGYDSTDLIFEKRVEVGQITDGQLKALLRALTAKAGLTFDEIVASYARRRAEIANILLDVSRDGPYQQFRCGTNPHFVAILEGQKQELVEKGVVV